MSNSNNIEYQNKIMKNLNFLQRLFQAYYKENQNEIPRISSFTKREFGFIPWKSKPMMIRHLGFNDMNSLNNYFVKNAPRHVYSSGSLYLMPENSDMGNKKYIGCDLITDIDVDHFYTPCKDDHDIWLCKKCEASGKGMRDKCPHCGSLKLKTLNWICDECLEIAKNEIRKLIFDFLIPDFGINPGEMHIAFSGHRGYHLKVENEKIRTLNTEERREMVDYLTGHNISFEILGLEKMGSNIYGFIRENLDWSNKIVRKLIFMLKTYSDDEWNYFLNNIGLNANVIRSFIHSREDFLYTLTSESHNLWSIEGFGLTNWKTFLRGVVDLIGVELDEPVTIDIHRLIRYPGTLHGKTGFKVQELSIEELDSFSPLNEPNDRLNPIVFESLKNMHKIKIIEKEVPQTRIKGETYGPYKQGEVFEVPNHIAVFLLCKEVAVLQ
ncbi:MAG: DNA primase small subunit PriS [Promethearchaeota archaeon]|nr:MAG: DNA primase small subunit PriS [Candidatus Lokiarchaeota archaeon]